MLLMGTGEFGSITWWALDNSDSDSSVETSSDDDSDSSVETSSDDDSDSPTETSSDVDSEVNVLL